jgi:hypothetical protein
MIAGATALHHGLGTSRSRLVQLGGALRALEVGAVAGTDVYSPVDKPWLQSGIVVWNTVGSEIGYDRLRHPARRHDENGRPDQF